MNRYIALYIGAALVMVPLDALWLGVVGGTFYKSRLGDLLLEQPRWGVAAAFYFLYLIGVVIFVMAPALANGGWRHALVYGALFGFFAYGVYDLTNWSTLRGFPASVALLDLAWGAVVTAATATLGLLIAQRFLLD